LLLASGVLLTLLVPAAARAQDLPPDDPGHAPPPVSVAPAHALQEIKGPDVWSMFLRWLNVDGMWVPTASGNGVIGIVGAHLAVFNIGRTYFYGPPGVLVIREETPTGIQVRPGYTWGLGFFITDFRFPGTSQQAHLFLNIAKVWTQGTYENGLDMGGLSITWKK
jgi:hypothetical protein